MAESTRGAAAPLAVTLLGAGMAWAGSQGGVSAGGLPVFAIAVAVAYLVQWTAFVPAYFLRTEKYFDLVGSFTYVTVMTLAAVLSQARDARSLLLLALVIVWAGRLGPFLFRRVRRAGKDDRFDGIKQSFVRFLTTWTLQGLWVSLTLAAALGAVTAAKKPPIDALTVLGAAVWAVGFGIEAIADAQKSRFRSDPANKGSFISSGLWSRSRHPNYFGEIVLWSGVALIALPALEGWRLLTLVSPVFVYLLLTRVSGVPLLEKKADEAWGGQEAYEVYKRTTPVLVPRLGRPVP